MKTSKVKLTLFAVLTISAVAGASYASSLENEPGLEQQKLHTKNGGPSLPPVKPSESQSFFDIIHKMWS